MAQAYAICLGCLAMVINIVRGILLQDSADHILTQALRMMLAFAVLGFVIGLITEVLVRQTVQANFRQALKKSR